MLCQVHSLLFSCRAGGNGTSCKKCPELVLTHGNVSYTDPENSSLGRRQEGSRAVFICNTGYRLSVPGTDNSPTTCIGGRWTGAIPSCEKGYCSCTGNRGYWKAKEGIIDWGAPKGKKLEKEYDYGENYGAYCATHDKKDYDPAQPKKDAWKLEPWYANRLSVTPTMLNSLCTSR